MVVSGQQAEVYIEDMDIPALFIPELKREPEAGKIGITAGRGFAPAYFANFSYQEIAKPDIKSKPVQPKAADEGTVMSWLVSNTFADEWLQGKYQLNQNDLKDIQWTNIKSESTGITNLARIQGISEKHNTVFCKLIIQSEVDQVKRLKFGYSDNVKAYVDGKAVYSGTNYYTSRDYRYLFSRRHMNFLHNPARQVGADRQQRQADGGEPFHHRLKMGAESTIPGKVDRSGRTFDDKTQPKRCI